MSTYFLLDPFEFPYYFYRIRRELIYVLSIVVCIPSTFCPTLGHHQGRIYYKRYVTFVLAYYYCVRASLPLKIMAFAFKWNSNGSRRKYVDIKCLLCLMKFAYIYIYIQRRLVLNGEECCFSIKKLVIKKITRIGIESSRRSLD